MSGGKPLFFIKGVHGVGGGGVMEIKRHPFESISKSQSVKIHEHTISKTKGALQIRCISLLPSSRASHLWRCDPAVARAGAAAAAEAATREVWAGQRERGRGAPPPVSTEVRRDACVQPSNVSETKK